MSNIVVPQLGESVFEARIAKWLKSEGDSVAAGEPIVELETEKVDLEVGADHAGVLTSVKRKQGEDVKVGDVLAVVDDAVAGNGAKSAAPARLADTTTTSPAQPAAAPASAPPSAVTAADTRATPTARRIAKDHDLNLGAVPGSGSAGRVMKQDVEKAITRPALGTRGTASRQEERVRMSKRRQTIARRLVEAQRTAAMLTTFNDVDMTEIMTLRARRKEAFKEQHGVSLGVSSFFVKAAIAALRAFPRLNAEIQGEEIVLKHYYDIGIAVGAEGGLVVPVLRDADSMSFAEIEQTIRDLARRADDGSLTLDDLAGGTFTITNGGVFGSLFSTPILNPPQVGILGLHKVADRAVPMDGQVLIRPMMYIALTYDHRIVDGREAVQFLVRIKEFVEDPARLLLEH